MFMETCLMLEEKVNEIRICNLSVLNDEITEEPLMKMVKCTTEHIVWDVETGSPIETKYQFKTFNTELYQTQV